MLPVGDIADGKVAGTLAHDLAPLFHRWLRDWEARGAGAAPTLTAGLGRSRADLESRFGAWLEKP